MSPRDESTYAEKARQRLRALTLRLLAHRQRATATSAVGPERGADRALLLVDVQNDFVGGALSVSGAERAIPALNRYLELFATRNLPIYLARDWHPPDSSEFVESGGALPAHCVRGTPGAAFPAELHVPVGSVVVSKGTLPNDHGYSAFAAHQPGPVPLRKLLTTRGVHTVYVGGLGPGVRATMLDGCQLGFDTVLLVDAVRGIDGTSARLRRAIDGMCQAGARVEQYDGVATEIAAAAAAAEAAASDANSGP